MRGFVRLLPLLFLTGWGRPLPAQVQADSVATYLHLLRELTQAGNFEQAQVESENFRNFLQRSQTLYTAEAIPVLSAIYQHNKDEKSALAFLADANRDALKNPLPQSRLRTIAELVKAYNTWKQPELAQACMPLLAAAQDSVAALDRRIALHAIERQLDSLTQLRRLEAADQARYVLLEQDRAILLGGAILLIFLGLVLANWKSNTRWRKRLAKKDLEIEFLRSDRFTATLTDEPIPVPQQEPVTAAFERGSYYSEKHPSGKVALLIEPNRQIVLYIKSLLADQFQVETAGTANEGLQMAANQLPDLIVCDAVLNGKTGIDVTRQIKLSERTNHIPVILLSDHHGNEGKLDALRAGADAWFSRPVLNNEFDEQVRQLLDSRKEKHQQFARCLHLYFSENRIPLDDPFLRSSVELIERHLSDPDFMAEELSRKMQLNKQLYFKKLYVLTGKEPMQLIREMRLEKAKALLEKRAGTPQAIAELVGFSSSGTFALAFKEYFGENTLLLQNDNRR